MIPRRSDGRVDPTSDQARAVRSALQHISTLDDDAARFEATAVLLPKLHRLGWWELFTHLAWPRWTPVEPAPYHSEFWEWALSITDERPDPYLGVWPRGGAKTTNAQMWMAYDALHPAGRDYTLYVQKTQKVAEKALAGIAALLQTPIIRHAFPEASAVYRDNEGHARDWTKARIRTGYDKTLDALGMDVAIRGIKVEEKRPDRIFFDDLEDKNDSEYLTGQKLDAITSDIIPARSSNCAIGWIQNLIQPNSIVSRVAGPNPPFMTDRVVSGPWPQVEGLKYRRLPPDAKGRIKFEITSGRFTWPEGLGKQVSEEELADIGPRAFLTEKQHDVSKKEGALWDLAKIEAMTTSVISPAFARNYFYRIVIGVDPSVGDGTGDECGIVVVGLDEDDNAYVLEDASIGAPPAEWCKQLARVFVKWGADVCVAEVNHGYLLLTETIGRYSVNLPVESITAKKGKKLRHEPVSTLSDLGRVWLAGEYPELDWQMRNYTGKPREDSPDRLDAMVYAVLWLLPIETDAGELISVVTPSARRR